MNRLPKVVVSATLAAADWGPVTVISADMAGQLAKLKQQPGIPRRQHAPGRRGLLDARLPGEPRVVVMPVLLGSGHATAAGAGPQGAFARGSQELPFGNVLDVPAAALTSEFNAGRRR